LSVKAKYTAVGRIEFATFLYVFMLSTVLDMLLVTNIVPMAQQETYLYCVAAHVGLVMAQFWCLFLNALLPLQLVQDGTKRSLWSLRLSCLGIGLVAGTLCVLTAKSM